MNELIYIDLDDNIDRLEGLCENFLDRKISEIPVHELEEADKFFASLESFYQSHLRVINRGDKDLRLPARQKRWFKRVNDLRVYLKINLRNVLFQPESIHADLKCYYRHAQALLKFELPGNGA